MSFRVIIAAVALLIVLGGAYAYYWHYVAGRLGAGIGDWADQQRALGNQIAFTSDPIAGFPFAFRTSFHGVALGFVQPGGTLSVQAETLTAQMQPWDLQDIAVVSAQPVTLALQSSDATQRALLSQGEARVQLRAGLLHMVGLTARDVTAETPLGTYVAAEAAAQVELPAAPPADYHAPWLSFTLNLKGLRLPAPQRAVTDGPIALIAAKGAIMGPVPLAASLQEAIRGWANAGGVVDLKSFDFAQGPLTLAGEGTVTLDEALQPLGALTIRAQGLPATIALLEQDGAIDARAAKTGGMMAKNLEKADAAGKPVVSVSLSLQQGYLWLGPIKLARLPAFVW